MTYIFVLALLVTTVCWENGLITLNLTKEYPFGEKILNSAGYFIDNPRFNQQGTQEIYINNEANLIYYGTLYFWSDSSRNPEELNLIMDTGSSWLWAPSSSWSGWPSSSSLQSHFFGNRGEGVKTIQYGSGAIKGNIVRGDVSLTTNRGQAVNDLKMLEITNGQLSVSGRTNWDGILGLLPTSISGSDLFVTKLYESGIIKKNAFGVSLTDTAYYSSITFGGYDPSIVPSDSHFTYLSLHNKNFWAPQLRHIKYGGKTLELTVDVAKLDTGTSLVILPKNTFNDFEQIVKKGKRWGLIQNTYLACPCQSKAEYEPFYFLLDEYEYMMSPENYVVETFRGGQKFCYFLIAGSTSSRSTSVLLGDAFLRNYYVYHDVENKKIGMYGKHMVFIAKPANSLLWIFIIGGGVALAIVLISSIVGVVLFIRHRLNKDSLLKSSSPRSDFYSGENGLRSKQGSKVDLMKNQSSSSTNASAYRNRRAPSTRINPRVSHYAY